MVILAVRIFPKVGKEEEVRAILEDFVPRANAEPGCVQYELFALRDGPGFYFFEKWASEEAYQVHRQVPYLTAFRNRAGELLERPNEVTFLTSVTD